MHDNYRTSVMRQIMELIMHISVVYQGCLVFQIKMSLVMDVLPALNLFLSCLGDLNSDCILF